MYRVKTTNRFNKDLKKCKKRGCDINLLMNTGTHSDLF